MVREYLSPLPLCPSMLNSNDVQNHEETATNTKKLRNCKIDDNGVSNPKIIKQQNKNKSR